MFRQLLLAVALAPLAVFSAASPRNLLGDSTGLFIRQNSATCGVSREVCEDSCMPIGAVCCNDDSSTYCRAGNRCIENGCCEIGEVCSGGGGTITNFDISPATTTFRSASATRTGNAAITSAAGSGGDDDTTSVDDDAVTTRSRTRSNTAVAPTATSDDTAATVSSERAAQTTPVSGGLSGANSNGNSNSNSNGGAAKTSSQVGGSLPQRPLNDKSLFGGLILAIAAIII